MTQTCPSPKMHTSTQFYSLLYHASQTIHPMQQKQKRERKKNCSYYNVLHYLSPTPTQDHALPTQNHAYNPCRHKTPCSYYPHWDQTNHFQNMHVIMKPCSLWSNACDPCSLFWAMHAIPKPCSLLNHACEHQTLHQAMPSIKARMKQLRTFKCMH